MRLTLRDEEFLFVLGTKTRAMTLQQVRRTWWGANKGGEKDASKRLTTLGVRMLKTTAHPVLQMKAGPVFAWSPREKEPNFNRLSYDLQKRWTKKMIRQTFVTLPGKRQPRTTELVHDVCVSEIYLTHFHPDLKDRFVHEDELSDWDLSIVPDALIRGGGQSGTDLAIDFGGRYSASKLKRLHSEYSKSELSYELW